MSILLLTALLFGSCNDLDKSEYLRKRLSFLTKTDTLSICIQPLGSFQQKSSALVAAELKKIYSGNVIINEPIPFPVHALNNIKTRYRADVLIKYLSHRTPKGHLTIGLTNQDISHTKKTKDGQITDDDYGIMGLGYCPGKSCIASTFRLKGKNRQEKLFKVAIHELAHTQGLNHCPDQTCFMRDAKGKDHLNELTGFCATCKKALVQEGWNLR